MSSDGRRFQMRHAARFTHTQARDAMRRLPRFCASPRASNRLDCSDGLARDLANVVALPTPASLRSDAPSPGVEPGSGARCFVNAPHVEP